MLQPYKNGYTVKGLCVSRIWCHVGGVRIWWTPKTDIQGLQGKQLGQCIKASLCLQMMELMLRCPYLTHYILQGIAWGIGLLCDPKAPGKLKNGLGSDYVENV